MSKNQFKPVSRQKDLVTQNVGKEILIYDLQINKAFSLNETSALVWQICNGQNTVLEIADNLSIQFQSPVSEDFVWLAVEQFKTDNLLEDNTESMSPFVGLSRREIIYRVGLASLITLPIISSLIAPEAIYAQSNACTGTSGRALGCTCTAISQCQPPSSRCCSNVPGDPRICSPSGLIATGSACGVNCDCVGACCVAGLCAADTISSGSPCVTTCQCVGSSTCSGGFCT